MLCCSTYFVWKHSIFVSLYTVQTIAMESLPGNIGFDLGTGGGLLLILSTRERKREGEGGKGGGGGGGREREREKEREREREGGRKRERRKVNGLKEHSMGGVNNYIKEIFIPFLIILSLQKQ